jgi:hypothetical protein
MSKREEDLGALVSGLAQIVRARADEQKLALTELWNLVAVELGLAGTITTPRFTMELTNFRLQNTWKQKERILKLNVAWRLNHPHHGLLGAEMRNCTVRRLKEGDLKFVPPISNYGNKNAHSIITTDDFGNFVIQHLDEKRYAARIGVKNIPAAFLPKRLPKVVREMEETVEEDWYVKSEPATGSPFALHDNEEEKPADAK